MMENHIWKALNCCRLFLGRWILFYYACLEGVVVDHSRVSGPLMVVFDIESHVAFSLYMCLMK